MRRLFANVQVHELFLEQAKLTPTATALVLPHEAKTVVTYQESSCHLFGVRRCLRFFCGCPYRFSLQPFRSREPPAKTACLLGEELGEAVRQLASVLEQLGPLLAVKRHGASLRKVEPRMRGANGEIVALSLPRSSAQVVSILGALLAGAGYLPMDDTGPEA